MIQKSGDIRVIFILGYTRSGSTLLEHLLSISPGTVAVGEMAYLWEQSVRNDSYCGCGSKWANCPFWKSILAAQPTLDFQQERSPDTGQFWSFFVDLFRQERSSNNYHYKNFLSQIESVYRSISDQTGGKVIIDSSKRPFFGLAASKIPGISVTFVHLVRDSRGCAFSWKKAKARMELGKNNFMSRLPVYRSTLAWVGNNLQAEILRTRGYQNIFLRYEDLVGNPTFEVNRILEQVGLPSISPGQDGIFHAPISHGTWGNPDRWSSMNGIRVTPDDRWMKELSARDFAITTLISAPLLKYYGYPFSKSRRRRSRATDSH
jgi:hypothetical protein